MSHEDRLDYYHEYSTEEWSALLVAVLPLGIVAGDERLTCIRHNSLACQTKTVGSLILADTYSQLLSGRAAVKTVLELADVGGTQNEPLVQARTLLADALWLYDWRISVITEAHGQPENWVRPNNRNRHQLAGRVLQRCAMTWVRLGGNVDYGNQYQTFFRAFVRPLLDDPLIRKKHPDHWSPWTEGMFRTHVTQISKSGDPRFSVLSQAVSLKTE